MNHLKWKKHIHIIDSNVHFEKDEFIHQQKKNDSDNRYLQYEHALTVTFYPKLSVHFLFGCDNSLETILSNLPYLQGILVNYEWISSQIKLFHPYKSRSLYDCTLEINGIITVANNEWDEFGGFGARELRTFEDLWHPVSGELNIKLSMKNNIWNRNHECKMSFDSVKLTLLPKMPIIWETSLNLDTCIDGSSGYNYPIYLSTDTNPEIWNEYTMQQILHGMITELTDKKWEYFGNGDVIERCRYRFQLHQELIFERDWILEWMNFKHVFAEWMRHLFTSSPVYKYPSTDDMKKVIDIGVIAVDLMYENDGIFTYKDLSINSQKIINAFKDYNVRYHLSIKKDRFVAMIEAYTNIKMDKAIKLWNSLQSFTNDENWPVSLLKYIERH